MARYGYNYFAPTPPKKLRRQVAADVNAQIAPYLTQLNKRYAAGSQMINQGTGALAASLALAQAQTHQIYADAQARDAALNAALSQQLTGQGNQLASSLSSTLGQAGQSTSGVAGLAGIGQGAAGAGSALGAANIARLIAQGAANENYSAQLPNLARLAGAQQQQNYRGQIETQRQGILEKVPGLISTGTQQAQDREFQKAVASQSGLINQQKLKADVAYKGAKLQQGQQRLQQGQQALDIRAAEAKVNNLYKQAQLTISQGRLQIAARNEQRLERTKSGKKGGFTPSQLSKMRGNALEAAKANKHGSPNPYYDPNADKKHPPYHKGVPDTKQTIGGGMSAQQAFRSLVNHGVPPSLADAVVGQVYGKWKTKGTNKRLGIP